MLLYIKWLVLLVGLFLVFVVVFVLKIGIEFVFELEEGIINLCVILVLFLSLEILLVVVLMLEEKLLVFFEVIYVLSCIGCVEIGGDLELVNNIEIYIGLKFVLMW